MGNPPETPVGDSGGNLPVFSPVHSQSDFTTPVYCKLSSVKTRVHTFAKTEPLMSDFVDRYVTCVIM